MDTPPAKCGDGEPQTRDLTNNEETIGVLSTAIAMMQGSAAIQQLKDIYFGFEGKARSDNGDFSHWQCRIQADDERSPCIPHDLHLCDVWREEPHQTEIRS